MSCSSPDREIEVPEVVEEPIPVELPEVEQPIEVPNWPVRVPAQSPA